MDEEMENEYIDIGESAATTGGAKKDRELTPEEYYEEAMEDLKLADVITRTKNLAGLYRRTARKLKMAGDYLDAPQKMVEYRKKSRRLREQGREEIYVRACEQMKSAHTVPEQRLAIELFRQIPGYRDADELALAYEKQNRKTARHIQFRNVLMAVAVMLAMAALLILIR